MKRLVFIFLIIFFFGNVLAQCLDVQININTASATELDKITYVGPATAIKIIAGRPFNSIDDLLNVSGIGDAKLKAIKTENLACVESSENKEVDSTENNVKEDLPAMTTDEEISINPTNIQKDLTLKIEELQVIKLNSKDIKNNNSIQENQKESSTKKYASFGLMALGILVLILLFLQRRKNGLE